MIEKAQEWIRDGKEVALATVIKTWGSSPRPVGSQLVVDEAGRFEGSVSGGCIETAVVEEALDVIKQGTPKRLFFGVSQDRAWEVGLACGGEIEIFVEKVSWTPVIERLFKFISAKRPAFLVTNLSSGENVLVSPDDKDTLNTLPCKITDQIAAFKHGDRNAIVETDDGSFFVHGFYPGPRLIIIGAVHIAKSLAQFGRIAGYEVLIVDPREAFANTMRFPDVPIHVEWPDEALEHIGVHSRTAVVTLTHDSKLDDPALIAALRSDAFYIGALGSKKNHLSRLQRLQQAGFTDEDLSRIHGPVGLDIGAISTEEIAISIMAQITEIRRKGSEKKNNDISHALPDSAGGTCCS